MNENKLNLMKVCISSIILYIFIVLAFYGLVGEQLRYRSTGSSIDMTAENTPIGEILKGDVIKQNFTITGNAIDGISLKFATYDRENTGTVKVQLVSEESQKVLFQQILDAATIKDNSKLALNISEPIENLSYKKLSIKITSDTGTKGNSVTLWYNNSENRKDQQLYVNGQQKKGILSFSVSEKNVVPFRSKYFTVMGAIGLVLVLYAINLIARQRKGKHSFGLNIFRSFVKYNFLLRQLVSRDFKTKYKRSVLGVLWSFINPVLTMIVQYVVFSTLFKSDIPNFPVYLLTGIVLFNFFSEATDMGLMSIVGNSSLITKVYIPKYIFPVSRVLSSGINLLISLIPLLVVLFITKTHITPSILLLFFSLSCTVIFCIGMSFLLSSAMVFFRDIRFLWNVLIMLWMYSTPIFYPESIIPEQFLGIFKLNPLYHFIRFSRTVILEGVSPEPQAYIFCLIAAFVPLFVGIFIFKKTQNKFVLNL
ncbi:ABC transporter permease [Paenibacillus polymyxa]|uniref:ABC transporter permease n=1 Tax=Paenibacillus polymyxa TaxID=1406 RepID=UPI002024EF84|nr:ABC transporter permease [Paenibacillus polymyxa]MDY8022726.1 ABC transporter permease [Paenibacillus polymyxa]URJ59867.1 ABC transporter permease [Paenibacillus polymyxa]